MLMSQSPEQTLIENAAKGDLDAFNQLVLSYQEYAYRHASALTGDPDTAEDITQESFIKAFQNINTFRGGSFRSWLIKIVTNTSRDLWRRKKRRPTISLFPEDDDGSEFESPAWISDTAATVERKVQENEATRQLYRMLDALPAAYRSVITLIDMHEMNYVEAAQILNIPLGTVKSRLARARIEMRNKLLGGGENTHRLTKGIPLTI